MKKRINISLDEEIAEQLKIVAEKSKRNVSQWITDRVMESYSEIEKENRRRERSEQEYGGIT